MTQHESSASGDCRLLNYLKLCAQRRGRRIREAVNRIAVDTTLVDIVSGPESNDLSDNLSNDMSHYFGLKRHRFLDAAPTDTQADQWFLKDGLLHAGIASPFAVHLLRNPEQIDNNEDMTPAAVDVPDTASAIQIAGRWLYDGFLHPDTAPHRHAWTALLQAGRRIAAWGFSFVPHPVGLGAAPMAFFESDTPDSVEALMRSAITTGPLMYVTVNDTRPGSTVSETGNWTELRFLAADAAGLVSIVFYAGDTEIRRLDARGRCDFDGTIQVKLPDGCRAVWGECRSVDGRICVVNPVWFD